MTRHIAEELEAVGPPPSARRAAVRPARARRRPAAAPWWQKVLRAFAVGFAGAFITSLLPLLDRLASGGDVDLSVGASLLIAAVAGAIAAGVRAAVALTPLFADDDVGLQRVHADADL